ncbi:unnamed protein product [Parajaminaea phylloscopi]
MSVQSPLVAPPPEPLLPAVRPTSPSSHPHPSRPAGLPLRLWGSFMLHAPSSHLLDRHNPRGLFAAVGQSPTRPPAPAPAPAPPPCIAAASCLSPSQLLFFQPRL